MIQEKDKYRLLIENLPDGLAYCKMVLDSSGKPVDYIFLEVNSSFEALSGLQRDHIIGKKVTELYPGIKGLGFDWIGVFDQVTAISTGQSIRFQKYLDQQDRWYEITAYSDQLGYFAVVFHDITENKKAEEELRQREKNFSTLVENAPDMIVRFNLDLQHIYCNAAVEHQFGVPVHRFIGKTFLEIDGPPEQLKSMHQLLKKALEAGEEQQTEQSFLLPSGQKYFQTRIVPERDEKGRIESLLAVTRDITKLKQAQDALRTSEVRYRLLVENANEVILVAQDGMLKFVNRMAVELMGYSEQELTSRPFPEFIHPDDRGMVVERHLRRLKGDVSQPRYAFRLVTRDGSIKWVEIDAVLIDWEGRPATLNFLNDITERKQAEDALRDSEEKYRTLFTTSSDAIMLIEPLSGKFTAGNQTTMAMFGLKNDYDFLSFGPWDFSPERQPDGRASAEKAKEMNEIAMCDGSNFFEWAHKRLNGEEFSANVRLTRMVLDKKTILQATVRDITEHKQAELLILIQRDLALAISFSHQLDKALPQCLDTMLLLSEMDCGRIYLIDQDSGDLNLICHRNLSPAFIKSVSHYKADSAHVRLVLQGKPIFTRYSEFDLPLSEVRKAEKLLAFVILPLIFENRVIGCLNLASKKLEDVSEINRKVLKSAATLMGEGITRLQTEEELKLSYEKLQKAIKSTIQAIALILEKRDPYTAGHQKRMTKLACAIAEEISLPKDKIEGLYIAGIIHDIGKINVPTEILSKPGRLSEIEFSLIKTHPQVGSDILKEMELPEEVSLIVLQHHERMDGSGYPSGLSGKDIILEARILAVADVVEAMASHRPYRPALGLDKALEEITKNKGKLYDPEVVDVCLKLFKEKRFKF
jgi:PAS domain S-box-containing protein/putative nucleotidyltransferase with HDIG domain